MPHFKAFGMMNLQYEIRISIKFMIKAQRVNANTSYYLFKWDRRYIIKGQIGLSSSKNPAEMARVSMVENKFIFEVVKGVTLKCIN